MSSLSNGFQDGYAVEFRAATFRLPSGVALISNLNLTIAKGETLVLLGRSGSGKTTTLKLI
ncbi:MAG TPA: ATP-binding cassette domain-containing protein, partial [Candidatus Acidoferrales bacterium]